MNRTVLYCGIGLAFGVLCLYAAVGIWLGVAQAYGGARFPGTVRDGAVQLRAVHDVRRVLRQYGLLFTLPFVLIGWLWLRRGRH